MSIGTMDTQNSQSHSLAYPVYQHDVAVSNEDQRVGRDDDVAVSNEDQRVGRDDDVCEHEDEAQAVLVPAMSAVAAHLTSAQTPAAEKQAALRKGQATAGFFDIPVDEEPESSSHESLVSANHLPSGGAVQASTPDIRLAAVSPTNKLSLPSPEEASKARDASNQAKESTTRSVHTRSVLGSALTPVRQRSRSAGQEALKRLQKALPSFAHPSNFLPSASSNTGSSSTLVEKSSSQSSGSSTPRRKRASTTLESPSLHSNDATLDHRSNSGRAAESHTSSARPKALRRVTSDGSLLYHSLSRASSLGDDSQFQGVREMVNMRLMALKDSLPDVPTFKLPRPSLSKLPVSPRKMSMVFSNGSSNDQASKTVPATSREDANALDQVLEDLTGDIVIMGGYRGSVLRSAAAPHQQVWAPVKLGFNMRRVNLEVPLTDEEEEKMQETIFPSGMLQHIGPIDISRKLLKKLRACPNVQTGKLRVWDYGYDWRLSPDLLSRRLQTFLEQLPCNDVQANTSEHSRGALVVAHSLGGLITRHAVNQRPELFSGVLYAGTPQRCVNILGPIRNGDVVLFNEKLLTAEVNFSIRTSFVFLPEDGFCFIDKDTGEEYPVDFYNPDDWVKWRFSPCINTPLPSLQRPTSSTFGSLIPNRLRSDSKPDKTSLDTNPLTDRSMIPQMNGGDAEDIKSRSRHQEELGGQHYMDYLKRTLQKTKKFRAELAHSEHHQSRNAYPPHAVLYGKSIPTVHGAWVHGREAIKRADAYDDLIFRPGDGVTLAKEAMLPEGYALVRAGRVKTERGHITMLGDMPAMAKALEALIRGRKKGIGLGAPLGDV